MSGVHPPKISKDPITHWMARRYAQMFPSAIPRRIALSRIPAASSKVALTFDDGPQPTYTRRILAVLAEYNAKATFFFTGENVSRFLEIAREVARAGHEIGCHGHSHRNLAILPMKEVKREIDTARRTFDACAGIQPRLIRPPGGNWSFFMVAYAACNGLTLVFWSIDPQDWRPNLGARDLVKDTLAWIRGGDIILLHECAATAEALPDLLSSLRTRRLGLATVSEILGSKGSLE